MPRADITELLVKARTGDRLALDHLMGHVYEELRVIARNRRPSGTPDPSLNTTALVHEVYLKLFDRAQCEFQDRRHFFAVAAMAMRQIVVDHARRRNSAKREGRRQVVDLDSELLAVDDRAQEILEVHDALLRLSELDPRLGQVVELRFFGGLSEDEVAEVVGRDARTVRRDWRKARALLYSLLGSG